MKREWIQKNSKQAFFLRPSKNIYKVYKSFIALTMALLGSTSLLSLI